MFHLWSSGLRHHVWCVYSVHSGRSPSPVWLGIFSFWPWNSVQETWNIGRHHIISIIFNCIWHKWIHVIWTIPNTIQIYSCAKLPPDNFLRSVHKKAQKRTVGRPRVPLLRHVQEGHPWSQQGTRPNEVADVGLFEHLKVVTSEILRWKASKE